MESAGSSGLSRGFQFVSLTPSRHRASQPFLRIKLGGVYQFKALCFSPSTAPQVFTWVFTLVSEWAYKMGSQLLRYLDDCLMLVEATPFLLQHREQLLQLCKNWVLSLICRSQTSSLPTSLSVSQDADRHHPKVGRPDELSDCQVSRVGRQVPSSPGSSY